MLDTDIWCRGISIDLRTWMIPVGSSQLRIFCDCVLLPPSSLLQMAMRVTTKILWEGTNLSKPQLWGDSLMKHHRWAAETWSWKPEGFFVSLLCASGRSCPLRHLFVHLHAVVSMSIWDIQHTPGPQFDCDLLGTSHTSENVPPEISPHMRHPHFHKLALQQVLFWWNLQKSPGHHTDGKCCCSFPQAHSPGREEDYSATSVLKSFSTSAASSRDPMD